MMRAGYWATVAAAESAHFLAGAEVAIEEAAAAVAALQETLTFVGKFHQCWPQENAIQLGLVSLA